MVRIGNSRWDCVNITPCSIRILFMHIIQRIADGVMSRIVYAFYYEYFALHCRGYGLYFISIQGLLCTTVQILCIGLQREAGEYGYWQLAGWSRTKRAPLNTPNWTGQLRE